jgi:hypothetical protein
MDLEALTHDLSFRKLLSNPAALARFEAFAAHELAAENVKFYKAVEQYKNIEDLNKLKEAALTIYRQFISEDAATQINIDGEDNQKIQEVVLKSDDYWKLLNAFNQAQTHIFQNMEKDTFQRFCRSPYIKGVNLDAITNDQPVQQKTDAPASIKDANAFAAPKEPDLTIDGGPYHTNLYIAAGKSVENLGANYSVQWSKSVPPSSEFIPIKGANALQYQASLDDVGATLRVMCTVLRDDDINQMVSAITSFQVVLDPQVSKPVNEYIARGQAEFSLILQSKGSPLNLQLTKDKLMVHRTEKTLLRTKLSLQMKVLIPSNVPGSEKQFTLWDRDVISLCFICDSNIQRDIVVMTIRSFISRSAKKAL